MTITWGACGHPLRTPEHRPPGFTSSYCRVCELSALPRTWCVDSDALRGNLREYEWIPAWRGREEEANACAPSEFRRDLYVVYEWEPGVLRFVGHTLTQSTAFLRDDYDPATGEPPASRYMQPQWRADVISIVWDYAVDISNADEYVVGMDVNIGGRDYTVVGIHGDRLSISPR